VVTDIGHNRNRLITVIHGAKTTLGKQTKGHVYTRSFLTTKNTPTAITGIRGLEQNEHGSRKLGGNDRKRRG